MAKSEALIGSAPTDILTDDQFFWRVTRDMDEVVQRAQRRIGLFRPKEITLVQTRNGDSNDRDLLVRKLAQEICGFDLTAYLRSSSNHDYTSVDSPCRNSACCFVKTRVYPHGRVPDFKFVEREEQKDGVFSVRTLIIANSGTALSLRTPVGNIPLA